MRNMNGAQNEIIILLVWCKIQEECMHDIAICADIHLISFDMVYCVIICNPVLNFVEAKQSLLDVLV